MDVATGDSVGACVNIQGESGEVIIFCVNSRVHSVVLEEHVVGALPHLGEQALLGATHPARLQLPKLQRWVCTVEAGFVAVG